MENSAVRKVEKILIMGLDNSGKTSVLLSLKDQTNIMSFCSLKPTRGIKIELFESQNLSLSCWDFGGQEEYRQEYLINFNRHSDKADKIFFVIDAQDYKRYDLALEYLEKIIDILVKNNKIIDFSIFLHKYDPNLERQEIFKNIDEILNKKLINKIERIIPSNFNHTIFKTTIYSVFEKILIS